MLLGLLYLLIMYFITRKTICHRRYSMRAMVSRQDNLHTPGVSPCPAAGYKAGPSMCSSQAPPSALASRRVSRK